MADVEYKEDIALSAAQVWATIGDFGGIRKWATLVQSETVEQTPAGPVRTLVMPDGRIVKELQAAISEHSYTYTMLERPEMKNYRSTVSVVPVDAGNCRIELKVHADPQAGEAEADTETRYSKNLRGNVKAMKRALGLA
jgi:hypothetical protein